MFIRRHKKASIRFRQWRRKNYAVFNGIGKHITIGSVKGVVADTLLRKQKAVAGFIAGAVNPAREADPEQTDDPPEELFTLATLPLLTCSPKEGQPPLFHRHPFHRWLKVQRSAFSHFHFKPVSKHQLHEQKVCCHRHPSPPGNCKPESTGTTT